MIPIRIKMTIKGDTVDLRFHRQSSDHRLDLQFGLRRHLLGGASAGMKTFFPDLPLNSGFYRCHRDHRCPRARSSSAKWPIAVTGFLMPFEKIMNSIYEMWSKHHAASARIACAFNLEYLLTGGIDARSPEKPIFMFYDWLPGGWGGRNGKDGGNVTTACFGTGLMSQPVEGQERGATRS